jgi:hypothetical protein
VSDFFVLFFLCFFHYNLSTLFSPNFPEMIFRALKGTVSQDGG